MIFFWLRALFFSNNCTLVRNVYTFMFQKLRFYPTKPNGVFCRPKNAFPPTIHSFHILSRLANGTFSAKSYFCTEAAKVQMFQTTVEILHTWKFQVSEKPARLAILFSEELKPPQDEREFVHGIRVSVASMCCKPRSMDLGGSAGPRLPNTGGVVGSHAECRASEHGRLFRCGVGNAG